MSDITEKNNDFSLSESTMKNLMTSQDFRNSVVLQRVSLITLIDYIQNHRDFIIFQHYDQARSAPRLKHLKKHPIFKAIYYKGDEQSQSVVEVDSVMIDLFESILFPFSWYHILHSLYSNWSKTPWFTSLFLLT